MDEVISWGKNIVYYILFIKLLINIIPKGNMTKYIKFFSGILLIIILIKPLLLLKNYDDKIVHKILDVNNKIEKQKLVKNTNMYNSVNKDLALNMYKEQIIQNISTIIEEEDIFIKNINIDIDEELSSSTYGNLLKVYLTVSKTPSNDNNIEIKPVVINEHEDNTIKIKDSNTILLEKKIKNKLFNFYNLSPDNINITIEQ